MPQYRKCAVKTCYDRKSVRHRFPNPKKFMCIYKQWIAVIGNEVLLSLDPKYVYDTYRVSHAHFTDRDNYSNNMLKKDAVPTLNLPNLQQSTTRQRVTDQPSTSRIMEELPINYPSTSTTEQPEVDNSGSTEHAVESLSRSGTPTLGLLQKVEATRAAQLTPKARRLYQIASHLSRSSRRSKVRRRITRNLRLSKNETLNEALRHVDTPIANFIRSQISLAGKQPKGRRYSLQDKIMGLILYKHSGRGYRALSKMFALPAKKTIMQLLRQIPINPGLNDIIFTNLAESVAKLSECDKNCILMFDEIALEPHIHLNTVSKEFEGFESHDEERREAVIADHALVFLVRGIVKDWKQPLAFTFCKSATKTFVLVRLIKKIIRRCQDAGLKVLGTVCDQGSTNQAAINYLMKTTVVGAIEGPGWKYFVVNGCKIFHIYDPPHLIKGIRNNLLTKNLIWESSEGKYVAKWADIEIAYAIDNAAGSLRAMPKLTECHVDRRLIRKMKVSHATQVFSHTVASVIALMARTGTIGMQGEKLSETALGTAKILKFFDDLMDSVNGHTLYPTAGKPLRCAVSRSSSHLQYWTEARQSLRRMYFQAEGHTEEYRPPSLSNWIVTINSIISVFEQLENQDVNYLKCRRLNQDPVENFFGQIRQQGVRDVNPSCTHFKSHFKTLLINNFASHHSISANCELDQSENVIVSVKNFVTQSAPIPQNMCPGPLAIKIPDNTLQYISKISLGYVSGFMMKYVKKIIVSCSVCTNDIFSQNPLDIWHDLIQEKEYLKTMPTKLKYCTPALIESFAKIYSIVLFVLPQVAHKTRCLTMLIDFVADKVSLPLNCDVHCRSLNITLINKFVTFLCYNWAVGVNRILSGKELRCIGNDTVFIQAKQMYLKKRQFRKS